MRGPGGDRTLHGGGAGAVRDRDALGADDAARLHDVAHHLVHAGAQVLVRVGQLRRRIVDRSAFWKVVSAVPVRAGQIVRADQRAR